MKEKVAAIKKLKMIAMITCFAMSVVLGKNADGVTEARNTEPVAKDAPLSSAPTITGTDVRTWYWPYNPDILGNLLIYGTGFDTNTALTVTKPGSTTATSNDWGYLTAITPTQITATEGFNNYDPGFYQFVATSSTGATSNPYLTAMVGNLNTLAVSSTDAIQNDQGSGTCWKFNLSNGSADGSFSCRGYDIIQGIAYDSTANTVTASDDYGMIYSLPSNHGFSSSSSAMGIDAKSGIGCFTEPAGKVGCFKVSTTSNPKPNYIAVNGSPWNIAMTTLNGQLTAVVLSVESDTITKLAVDSSGYAAITGSVALSGLTAQSKLPLLQGGWQLVDLTTITEVKRIALSGTPFRIAKNEIDGSVVVAFADPDNARTVFSKIAIDGTTTPLEATVPFLSTGLAVSADGTQLYCANRGTFQIATLASCPYTIGASGQSAASSGGSGSITVAASSCGSEWTATSNVPWITVMSGSGTGNGTVSYSVTPNTSASPRTGTIEIGDQTCTITQGGAQYTLAVANSGNGVVASSPAGINCGSDCSAPFNTNSVVTLVATPAFGYAFAGWSGGGCSGAEETCSFTLTANETITATFAQDITVGSAGAYSKIQNGYYAAGNWNTIEVQTGTYPENLGFNRNIAVSLEGGYDSGFSAASSNSVIKGTLTISNGTVTVQNIIIQ